MKIDRIHKIVQDLLIELNPEESCQSCLFSEEPFMSQGDALKECELKVGQDGILVITHIFSLANAIFGRVATF